jgi:hypothetical protein
MLIFVLFAVAFLLISVKNRASLKMALVKCQNKNIKSSEVFETYKEFNDNCWTIIRYDVRFKIQNPPIKSF